MLDKQDLKQIGALLDSRLTVSEKRTDARFFSMEGRLDTMDENMKSMEKSLDGKLSALEERLDAKIDTKLSTMEERIDGKMTSLEERMNGKLSSMEEHVDQKLTSMEKRIIVGVASFIEDAVLPQFDEIRRTMATKDDVARLRTDTNAKFTVLCKTLERKAVFTPLDTQAVRQA